MLIFVAELAAAIRGLLRRPRALVLPVAVLAVGIALSVTAFSVIQGVLLRGLPVEGGDRIVMVSTGPGHDRLTPLADMEALVEASQSEGSAFEVVEASLALNFMLTGEDAPTVSRVGAYVSGDLMSELGVEPVLGRAIEPADVEPAAPAVSVLGYGLWQSVFDGDPEVLGETLLVNRMATTIVGVMPPGFGFPYRQELWSALRPEALTFGADSAHGVAWLKPGRSIEQARAELELLAGRLDEADPLAQERGHWVVPFVEATVDPPTRRALQILLVAAALVLLVACANAANLRLASTAARRQELAVRTALGAGNRRLVAMLVAESAVVAALAAVAGLALAWMLVREAGRALLQGSLLRGFWMDIRIDTTVFLVTVGLAAAATLLAGLAPALLALRRRGAAADLRSGARVQRGSSRAFVAVEVGLCFALIVAAGGLTRNALSVLGVDPGFDGRNLVTSIVNLYQNAELEPGDGVEFFAQLQRRLEARPEVERVAWGQGPPWGWATPVEFSIGSAAPPPGDELPTLPVLQVGEGYLETVGLPLIAGRAIGRDDLDSDPRRLVVSSSFAERRLGGVERAVGRRLTLRERERTWPAIMIGVTADVGMARLQRDPGADELAYMGRRIDGGATVLLRARLDEESALETLREEVAALDPLAAVYNGSSFERDRAASTWEQRRLSQLFLLFGAAALILVAGGLYAVVDLAGRQRARELALRLALGAVPAQVRRLVVREGMVHLAAGSVVGAAALGLLAPALREYLIRVRIWDPWMIGGSLALLALVVAAAAFGPARRAARLDPAETLRAE
ncbi:MAG TPA: ABC transporter permease [Thermoanaerobaculia bacterium]|nr:ABC transporter permease [Thermoanaerobaculia bacterium]